MNDEIRKAEMLKVMNTVEYYPAVVEIEDIGIDRYTKVPFSQIAALGTAFSSLTATFQKFSGNYSTSALCRVTVPNGRSISDLAKRRNSPGFIGSVLKENGSVGGGQATINPLSINPEAMFMAAALMSINKKLDSIQETQREILEFLEQKEKSVLRGNLNFLIDIQTNYKFNWDNEKYKNSNHIKVLDIKQESEQNILFYRDRIHKNLNKKTLFHRDKQVAERLESIQSEFKEYQLALYLFSFSSFLEVMLLENYESAYLDSIVQKINDYAYRYRDLYTVCYNQIEEHSKSSVQSFLLSGLVSISKATGETVSKIPILSKTQIDESLIGASNRLEDIGERRVSQTMEQFLDIQISEVAPFVANIEAISNLYNNPIDVLFDQDDVYILLPESA